jgi:hypothetical protein
MGFPHWFRTEDFTVSPDFDRIASHTRLAEVLPSTMADLTIRH